MRSALSSWLVPLGRERLSVVPYPDILIRNLPTKSEELDVHGKNLLLKWLGLKVLDVDSAALLETEVRCQKFGS